MSYIDEVKLMAELEAADAAGDTSHAQQVADQIHFQRNVITKYGDETGMQIINAQNGGDSGIRASDNMDMMDRVTAGMGRGFTDIGQGIKQLGMRAGDAVGLVDEQSVTDYDQQIAKESQYFDKDLGQTTSGNIGRIAGQALATAPAGMLAGRALAGATGVNNLQNAGRLASAGRMGAHGAGIGAVEGALMPVLNGADNFWSDKAVDAGIGAATGGVLGGAGGAIKGGAEIADQGVVNTMYQGVSNPKDNKILGSILGDKAESTANKNAAKFLGDESMLTNAEMSGGKGAQFLENMAEQSLFTADEVLEKSTVPKLNKFKESVLNQADNISKNNYTPEQMGLKLQQLTTSAGSQLFKKRSAQAAQMYGKIDNMAKGQKIVSLDNTIQVMGDIVNKSKGVQGSDIQKVASQIKKMVPEIKTGMTAKQALRQLQAWQTGQGGNVFKGLEKIGADDHYRKQLKEALLADMDNVQGGLGDAVRQANTAYRQASNEIEALGFSILGRTAGKELASDVTEMAANQIAPEKVLDSFVNAKPSQVVASMKYMQKFDPEVANDFRAHYIKSAINEASFQSASSGVSQTINPVQFLNSLGIKSGKKGVEGLDKFKAIMAGVPNSDRLIDSMVRVARIKGDSFGRNFSGTAATNQANQFMSALGSLWSAASGGATKVAGTAGHYFGMKGVAKSLTEDVASWQPTRLNWQGNRVSDGLAAAGALTVPQTVQSQRNDQNQPGY